MNNSQVAALSIFLGRTDGCCQFALSVYRKIYRLGLIEPVWGLFLGANHDFVAFIAGAGDVAYQFFDIVFIFG